MISARHALAALLLLLLMVSQAPAQTKLAPPAAEELAQALKLVQETYGQEYEAAKSSEQKSALARSLLSDAASTQDPTSRYAVFHVAKEIATQAGDGLTAFRAADEMGRQYQVKLVAMKSEMLASLAKAARTPVQHRSVAEQSLQLLDAALADNDFTNAAGMAELALDAARKSRDGELVKSAAARSGQVDEIARAYAEVAAAEETLQQNPTDAAANLAVGKFLCFTKHDWEKGVPMLALGGDADLREAALAELRDANKPAGRRALGDNWWALAEAQTGDAQQQLRQRAAHWYYLALDSLEGLPRELVRKRLLEIQSGSGGLKFPAGAVVVFTFEKADFYQQGNNLLLKDRSGRGNHGLVTNPEVVPGKVGDGLDVIGDKRSYIDCHNTPSLHLTDAITVCAWVLLRKPSGWHTHYFISKDDWQKGARGFVLRGAPGNRFSFAVGDASHWHAVDANAELQPNEWQHIAATYDGGTMILYLNGEASGTKNVTAKIEPSPFKLRIGRSDYAPNRFMTGLIDEVAVFGRALAADEIRTIYQLGQIGQSIGQ